MIDLFFLIVICFFIANQVSIWSKPYKNVMSAVRCSLKVKVLFVILCILIILFSGLRTTYNDTQTYMYAFTIFDVKSVNISTVFQPYGGFDMFQMIIKKYITADPQGLILISSIITNSIFLWFYAKYAKYFGWTILAYFIIGPYMFSMAGLKQIIAMSISLFAIDNLLRKNNIKFAFWILVAVTFHPYIICLFVLPFFTRKILGKEIIFVILISTVGMLSLEPLMKIAGLIGKDYTLTELTAGTINPFRVMVESIPIILMILYRQKLNRIDSSFIQLGFNMMIFSFFMIFIGLFYNPIYFARIGTYFSSLSAVCFPILLIEIYKNSFNFKFNFYFYYAIFILYFILDLTKLGAISITTDLFNHIFN